MNEDRPSLLPVYKAGVLLIVSFLIFVILGIQDAELRGCVHAHREQSAKIEALKKRINDLEQEIAKLKVELNLRFVPPIPGSDKVPVKPPGRIP